MRPLDTARLATTASIMALLAASSAAGMAAGRELSGQDGTDDPKLETKVTVNAGPTTLAKLLAQMSGKTGETLIATDAIKDRRVTAEFARISARQVLDTLAAMYDWRWYRQQPGVYVIDRRTFRAPAELSAIPATMQSALPVDIRAFLKLPDPKTKDPNTRTMNAVLPYLTNAGYGPFLRLKSSLTDYFLKNDSLPVRDLSPRQRDDLIAGLFFARMIGTIEILHDDDGPHHYQPAQFVIHFENLGLHVVTNPSVLPGSGFGTQVFRMDGSLVPVDYGRVKQ
jgi:hypothetical protein